MQTVKSHSVRRPDEYSNVQITSNCAYSSDDLSKILSQIIEPGCDPQLNPNADAIQRSSIRLQTTFVC
jgi:hypothetical protein